MKQYIILFLLFMLKTSCSNAQGNSDIPLPPGKSIYIPKDLQGMDLQNPVELSPYGIYRELCHLLGEGFR